MASDNVKVGFSSWVLQPTYKKKQKVGEHSAAEEHLGSKGCQCIYEGDCSSNCNCCSFLFPWAALTVLGASVTNLNEPNLNEPPRALATSTIMWVRS